MDSSLCYKCHHTRSWTVLLLFSAIERDPGNSWGSVYRYVGVVDYKTLTKYSHHVSISGFGIREIFALGIENQGIVSFNPESWVLESGIQLPIGMRNPTFVEKGSNDPVPEFRNPQRGIQNSRMSWITSVINAKKKPIGKDILLCYESLTQVLIQSLSFYNKSKGNRFSMSTLEIFSSPLYVRVFFRTVDLCRIIFTPSHFVRRKNGSTLSFLLENAAWVSVCFAVCCN